MKNGKNGCSGDPERARALQRIVLACTAWRPHQFHRQIPGNTTIVMHYQVENFTRCSAINTYFAWFGTARQHVREKRKARRVWRPLKKHGLVCTSGKTGSFHLPVQICAIIFDIFSCGSVYLPALIPLFLSVTSFSSVGDWVIFFNFTTHDILLTLSTQYALVTASSTVGLCQFWFRRLLKLPSHLL